jgi:hypothetical protein
LNKCEVNKLENWVVNIFKEIEEAAARGDEYTLHLDKKTVQDVAFESRSLEWIEIY